MRSVLVLAALLILAAGCVSTTGPTPMGPAPHAEGVLLACRLVDEAYAPLVDARCIFEFGTFSAINETGPKGLAVQLVPRNETGTVHGEAAGRISRGVQVRADAPKTIEMVLAKVGSGPTQSSVVSNETTSLLRAWDVPKTIVRGNNEPHIAVDSKGVLYYAPTSKLFRSTNGGDTWTELAVGGALPTLGSDTSVSVAPDDSVWFSRYWGYAGGTLGCTSVNRGDAWTCDNSALPGATDRMWIVGVSQTDGYLQTNEGLYHHVWAKTTTGSTKYVPHGSTTQALAVRNGNMVYDPANKAVYQIEFTGGTQRLYRVDGLGGVLTAQDTRVPATFALPWLSVHDGVLWTTGEKTVDGARHVYAARSADQGKTWQQFRVSQAPQTSTFSYVAAGPDGRVAVVYYGSDKPGAPQANGGSWSVYVAETNDGNAEHPTWLETLVVPQVHKGNLCIGLNCEQTGGDPRARYAGDLIGITMDAAGNAHLAYCVDQAGTMSDYVRQRVPAAVGNP